MPLKALINWIKYLQTGLEFPPGFMDHLLHLHHFFLFLNSSRFILFSFIPSFLISCRTQISTFFRAHISNRNILAKILGSQKFIFSSLTPYFPLRTHTYFISPLRSKAVSQTAFSSCLEQIWSEPRAQRPLRWMWVAAFMGFSKCQMPFKTMLFFCTQTLHGWPCTIKFSVCAHLLLSVWMRECFGVLIIGIGKKVRWKMNKCDILKSVADGNSEVMLMPVQLCVFRWMAAVLPPALLHCVQANEPQYDTPFPFHTETLFPPQRTTKV